MFKLNRKLEYALIALKHMYNKNQGELTTAKEISSAHHTPFDATSRALQIMANKGLLKSEQGAYGGYLIQKNISKISLLNLIEMILGSVRVVNCLGDESCHCSISNTCNIVSPITWLNGQLEDFYGNLTLRDLLEAPGVQCPASDGFEQRFAV